MSASPPRPAPPNGVPGAKYVLRAPCLVLAYALLSGCAPGSGTLIRPAPGMLPPGSPLRSPELGDDHAWVRHHLMFGEFEQALKILSDSPVAPSDRLVRALQEGIVLHHAREYARSNAVLEWAEGEADRRFTRSLARAAGSMVVSDRVLAYTPTAAELSMIPYYRMLNYLALGEREGALVESRKANAYLARGPRAPEDRCQEDALLQYMSGLVQRAGGEVNDALVSLRQAEGALRLCDGASESTAPRAVAADLALAARAAGLSEIADSAAQRYGLNGVPAGSELGDLVVLVEHGFVAHRAQHTLHVPILPEEIEGLEGGEGEQVLTAAVRITERMLHNLGERSSWGQAWDDELPVRWADALEGAYVLRLAWPVVRRERSRPVTTRVWVGDSLVSVIPLGDLSAVVQREMEDQRPAILARLVARGLTKYLISREVEKKAEAEGGELAGFLVGRLSNLAANELEQADTRSWSLLPDRISVVRARLPAGQYRVRIETLGAGGEILSTRELEPVSVQIGDLALLSQRVWENGAGEPPNPVGPERAGR